MSKTWCQFFTIGTRPSIFMYTRIFAFVTRYVKIGAIQLSHVYNICTTRAAVPSVVRHKINGNLNYFFYAQCITQVPNVCKNKLLSVCLYVYGFLNKRSTETAMLSCNACCHLSGKKYSFLPEVFKNHYIVTAVLLNHYKKCIQLLY